MAKLLLVVVVAVLLLVITLSLVDRPEQVGAAPVDVGPLGVPLAAGVRCWR